MALKFVACSKSKTERGHKIVGSLFVNVRKANDLPEGLKDFTVQLLLLPNYNLKKKTSAVANTVFPVWDEQFEYELVKLKELKTERVLEVTICGTNSKGSNDFIGGLRLGSGPNDVCSKEWMNSMGEEVSHWDEVLAHSGEWVERWHILRSSLEQSLPATPLQKDSSPASHFQKKEPSLIHMKAGYSITGEVLLSVQYTNGQLEVYINRARRLATTDKNRTSNPYVKIRLLSDTTKYPKKKTEIKKNTLTPVYRETFQVCV